MPSTPPCASSREKTMAEPTVCCVMRCSSCGQITRGRPHACRAAPSADSSAACGKCGRIGGKEMFPVKHGRLKSPCRACRRKEPSVVSRQSVSDSAKTNRWRSRNRHKNNAQQKLRHAVKIGKIVKTACEKCGNQKSEGHHDDYSKPLSVRWLCRSCHANEHRRYAY